MVIYRYLRMNRSVVVDSNKHNYSLVFTPKDRNDYFIPNVINSVTISVAVFD